MLIAAVADTPEGEVTLSKPYLSHASMHKVVRVTFIKNENKGSGYGISKEFHQDLKFTARFVEHFIQSTRDML